MEVTQFTVVRNDEEQYSIWDAERPVPAGWHPQGMTGTKEQCLEFIREHWVDMTPASVRRQLGR